MDSVRNNIRKRCDEMINKDDKLSKMEGLYTKQALDKISCIRCLDTTLLWKDRDGLPFSAWDGRGYYDYINCTSCGNGGWNHCSHSNTEKMGNKLILHYRESHWDSRYSILRNFAIDNNEIKQIAHDTINSLTLEKKIETLDNRAKWELCKSHTVNSKEKTLEMSVNGANLVKIVTGIVEASFGNVFCLAGLAKELNLSLSHKVKTINEEDRIIKNKDNKYLFIKVIISKEEKKGVHFIKYSKSKLNHEIYVSLLVPKNNKAQEICDSLMNIKAENIVKDLLNNF